MAQKSDSGLGHIDVPLLILRPRQKPSDTSAHQPRRPAYLFGEHKPADTVVGVETLAGPGYLIEVDAIAVTDR